MHNAPHTTSYSLLTHHQTMTTSTNKNPINIHITIHNGHSRFGTVPQFLRIATDPSDAASCYCGHASDWCSYPELAATSEIGTNAKTHHSQRQLTANRLLKNERHILNARQCERSHKQAARIGPQPPWAGTRAHVSDRCGRLADREKIRLTALSRALRETGAPKSSPFILHATPRVVMLAVTGNRAKRDGTGVIVTRIHGGGAWY